jgi:hypothetical protein
VDKHTLTAQLKGSTVELEETKSESSVTHCSKPFSHGFSAQNASLQIPRPEAELATFWWPIRPSIHEMRCPQQTKDVLPAP